MVKQGATKGDISLAERVLGPGLPREFPPIPRRRPTHRMSMNRIADVERVGWLVWGTRYVLGFASLTRG